MRAVPMIPGLSAIAHAYDGIVCDVWGVLHNGVVGYREAAEALTAFRAGGRPVVLLTNAPRPAREIGQVLARFQVPPEAYDAIVTSGDVTRTLLEREGPLRAWHLGPDRDLPLFAGLPIERVPPEAAQAIVCTGLFDDTTETAESYREVLTALAGRGLRMICANPDVVVERGDQLVYCAGALAQLYEELGGPVTIVGKPYKAVYDAALAKLDDAAGRSLDRRRVLAIGDAFPTDVKGAWGQGLDVLMVTAGIHAADFGPADTPAPAIVAKRAAIEGVVLTAAMPRLAW